MKTLVDVVNFNADASCLSTESWFRILVGGDDSCFCRWLRLYVDNGKKVVLGLTGVTISDLAVFNPEAIVIIKSSPEIFQIILRPFVHDSSLIRTSAGFMLNLKFGMLAIKREFGNALPYYLPPEFMLTNEQIASLAASGVSATFIHPVRFPTEISSRIPARPYYLKGIFNSTLPCIPFHESCTKDYLHAIHMFDSGFWNLNISSFDSETVFSWRDGESPFLLPDSIERESCWLKSESENIIRVHLDDANLCFEKSGQLDEGAYHSYPVHSFLPWMREFRTFAYLTRIMKLEELLPDGFKEIRLFTWLLTIGSDMFSAIEKPSPVITIKEKSNGKVLTDFTILRSERGFEGEEYLVLAEECQRTGVLPRDMLNPELCLHHRRYLARVDYLDSLSTDGIA